MSDQVPNPPDEIVVEKTELDDQPYPITHREYRDIENIIKRLTGIVDGMATKIVELAESNNKLITAFNNLHKDQGLINAVVAEVIAMSDQAEMKIDEGVARTIAQKHLVLHDDLEGNPNEFTYRVKYEIDGVDEATGSQTCRLVGSRFDSVSDAFVSLDPLNPQDLLMMRALQYFVVSNQTLIQPGQEYQISKTIDPLEAGVQTDTAFKEFMENTMGGQNAVGEVNTTAVVSPEYTEGALKFVFTEASDTDETPFAYNAWTMGDDGHWYSQILSDAEGNHYASLVRAAGGKPDESWFISYP